MILKDYACTFDVRMSVCEIISRLIVSKSMKSLNSGHSNSEKKVSLKHHGFVYIHENSQVN